MTKIFYSFSTYSKKFGWDDRFREQCKSHRRGFKAKNDNTI